MNMSIADEKITLYPGMAGVTRSLVKQMKDAGIDLLSVDIMVTQKCNFKCYYCYADSAPEDLPEFLMSEVKDIVQQCIKMKVPIINIQGGEPTFWHPSDWKGPHGEAFFHFVEYIKSEYKKAKISLNLVSFTNVSLLNDEKAQRLYNSDVGLCCKLDSLKNETQDGMLCTPNGLKSMMKGFKSLIKIGYGKPNSPTISTNTVVTPENYDQIPEVFRWSRQQGFKPFVIPAHVHGRLQNFGQNKGLDRTLKEDKQNLSPLDIKKLFEELARIDREEFKIEWYAKSPWVENKACSRHLGGIHIRADGIVVPCSEAPNYWALGDIRKKTLKEIVNDKKVQKFRNIYSNLHTSEKCSPKNCEMASEGKCYGCRTRFIL